MFQSISSIKGGALRSGISWENSNGNVGCNTSSTICYTYRHRPRCKLDDDDGSARSEDGGAAFSSSSSKKHDDRGQKGEGKCDNVIVIAAYASASTSTTTTTSTSTSTDATACRLLYYNINANHINDAPLEPNSNSNFNLRREDRGVDASSATTTTATATAPAPALIDTKCIQFQSPVVVDALKLVTVMMDMKVDHDGHDAKGKRKQKRKDRDIAVVPIPVPILMVITRDGRMYRSDRLDIVHGDIVDGVSVSTGSGSGSGSSIPQTNIHMHECKPQICTQDYDDEPLECDDQMFWGMDILSTNHDNSSYHQMPNQICSHTTGLNVDVDAEVGNGSKNSKNNDDDDDDDDDDDNDDVSIEKYPLPTIIVTAGAHTLNPPLVCMLSSSPKENSNDDNDDNENRMKCIPLQGLERCNSATTCIKVINTCHVEKDTQRGLWDLWVEEMKTENKKWKRQHGQPHPHPPMISDQSKNGNASIIVIGLNDGSIYLAWVSYHNVHVRDRKRRNPNTHTSSTSTSMQVSHAVKVFQMVHPSQPIVSICAVPCVNMNMKAEQATKKSNYVDSHSHSHLHSQPYGPLSRIFCVGALGRIATIVEEENDYKYPMAASAFLGRKSEYEHAYEHDHDSTHMRATASSFRIRSFIPRPIFGPKVGLGGGGVSGLIRHVEPLPCFVRPSEVVTTSSSSSSAEGDGISYSKCCWAMMAILDNGTSLLIWAARNQSQHQNKQMQMHLRGHGRLDNDNGGHTYNSRDLTFMSTKLPLREDMVHLSLAGINPCDLDNKAAQDKIVMFGRTFGGGSILLLAPKILNISSLVNVGVNGASSSNQHTITESKSILELRAKRKRTGRSNENPSTSHSSNSNNANAMEKLKNATRTSSGAGAEDERVIKKRKYQAFAKSLTSTKQTSTILSSIRCTGTSKLGGANKAAIHCEDAPVAFPTTQYHVDMDATGTGTGTYLPSIAIKAVATVFPKGCSADGISQSETRHVYQPTTASLHSDRPSLHDIKKIGRRPQSSGVSVIMQRQRCHRHRTQKSSSSNEHLNFVYGGIAQSYSVLKTCRKRETSVDFLSWNSFQQASFNSNTFTFLDSTSDGILDSTSKGNGRISRARKRVTVGEVESYVSNAERCLGVDLQLRPSENCKKLSNSISTSSLQSCTTPHGFAGMSSDDVLKKVFHENIERVGILPKPENCIDIVCKKRMVVPSFGPNNNILKDETRWYIGSLIDSTFFSISKDNAAFQDENIKNDDNRKEKDVLLEFTTLGIDKDKVDASALYLEVRLKEKILLSSMKSKASTDAILERMQGLIDDPKMMKAIRYLKKVGERISANNISTEAAHEFHKKLRSLPMHILGVPVKKRPDRA